MIFELAFVSLDICSYKSNKGPHDREHEKCTHFKHVITSQFRVRVKINLRTVRAGFCFGPMLFFWALEAQCFFLMGPDAFYLGPRRSFFSGPADMFIWALGGFQNGPWVFFFRPYAFLGGPDAFCLGPDAFFLGPHASCLGPPAFWLGPSAFWVGPRVISSVPPRGLGT